MVNRQFSRRQSLCCEVWTGRTGAQSDFRSADNLIRTTSGSGPSHPRGCWKTLHATSQHARTQTHTTAGQKGQQRKTWTRIPDRSPHLRRQESGPRLQLELAQNWQRVNQKRTSPRTLTHPMHRHSSYSSSAGLQSNAVLFSFVICYFVFVLLICFVDF